MGDGLKRAFAAAAETRLKPGDIKTLQWFAARIEPCALFGRGEPSLTSVRRLHDAGLVETVAVKSGQFIPYQISDKGRAALAPGKS
jgi:DNA-binding transcriptional regulator PaaX